MSYDNAKIIDQFILRKRMPDRFLTEAMLHGGHVNLINEVYETISTKDLVERLLILQGRCERSDQLRLLIHPSPMRPRNCLEVIKKYGFDVHHHASLKDGSLLVICKARHNPLKNKPLYSAIIPCRNEGESLRRIPGFFQKTQHPWELVFVEGNSSDNTLEIIQDMAQQTYDGVSIQAFQQSTKGKAGAVFEGFDAAQGEIYFIFDGDATVQTEDLIGMAQMIQHGEAEFCNGNRLFFHRAKGSMKSLNRLGNTFFALCHTWVTKRYFADVFCGTKAFPAEFWPALKAAKKPFEGHDRYGDFQLLFAAYKLGLKVEDFPVHYLARVSGETTLSPFAEGMNFVKSTLQAKRHLKHTASTITLEEPN